ncbi:zinc finger protein OZF isoform X4 [Rhipicephalus sanguineus]|uniref:zinc finger protein OZF isoform X4 n=2 Tax=Rhipicephalus sanguineus TaxID=34632 RepID=UPI0020C4A05A|nr:zinc finger protein OZF isoform X4 [Rhipicephalus sanguineus]
MTLSNTRNVSVVTNVRTTASTKPFRPSLLRMNGIHIKAEPSRPESMLLFGVTDVDIKMEPISSPESMLPFAITLLDIKVELCSPPNALLHAHDTIEKGPAEVALGSSSSETSKDIVDNSLRISEDVTGPLRKKPQGSVNGSHKCDICGWCFTNKHLFKRHQTVHTGEKRHQCETCGQCFARSCGLKRHQQVHTGERPHACPVCGRKFAKRTTLNQHHEALHTNEKPYACTVCGQKFSTKSYLDKHKRVHMDEVPYACQVCPSKFRQKASLEKHKQLHASGVQMLPCPECGITFKAMKYLMDHSKWHNMEKPHLCHLCPARFPRKSFLERHLFTHKGEKPYKCSVCERLYSRIEDLNKHMRRVHMDGVGAAVSSTDSKVEVIMPSNPIATEPREDADMNEAGPSTVACGRSTSVMPQTSRTEISGGIKDSNPG